jgi:asparagine synthetase B (glutamine-hydrolysing)
LRTSLGRLVRRPRQEGPAPPAPWLTLSAATHLKGAEQQTDDLWRPFRQPGVLTHPHELGLLRFAELEIEPFGTELRRPFRDRRLVEYLLAVPPRLQYRPGRRKFLLRRALRHRLPAEIVRRRHLTSLQPLFDRGLGDRAHAALLATLADPAATWPRYVRREWLRERLRTGPKPESDGVERLVLWSCWCVEIWQQRLRAHLAAEGLIPVLSEDSEALTE